jgi:amino acid adenylation domain-containing protein/FkbM family methyltransferase
MLDNETIGSASADGVWASIARHAAKDPQAVAVEYGDRALTYRDLDEETARFAAGLLACGAPPPGLVALDLPRTPEYVVAVLGSLRAGFAYLPAVMGGFAPQGQQRAAFDRAAPRLLVTSGKAPRDGAVVPIVGFDDVISGRARASFATSPDRQAADLAYVMPTSGSMGALKLVEVTQGSILRNLKALDAALSGIHPEDAYLHFASFSFSSSVRQLLLPLLSGARVVLASEAERRDPQALMQRLRASGVSVLDIIPSVLGVVLDAIGRAGQSDPKPLGEHLRLLLTASERLPGSLAKRCLELFGPKVAFYNMYGQTETAGIVSIHRVAKTETLGLAVPIGRPILGTAIYPVGQDGATLPTGEVGELLVVGPGVARGYRGDDVLSQERFGVSAVRGAAALDQSSAEERTFRTGDLGQVGNDGVIKFHGRADTLVKIRGQRVDTARLENVIAAHPAVAEAIVVAVGEGTDQAGLRAFVLLRDGYLDAGTAGRLRSLPDGLRVLDLNPADTEFMYAEIFEREVYLGGFVDLPAEACVIDAGANIGLFSLFASQNAPRGRVVAFEPAPAAADALLTNLKINGRTNVEVRVEALSGRKGSATLTYYPHSTGMTSLYASQDEERATLSSIIANQLAHGDIAQADELANYTEDLVDSKLIGQRLECTLTTLSDVLDELELPRVDLLKIDVQKAEFDLLGGIREEHWPLIRQIVAEVHDVDGRLDRMVALLSDRGFDVSTRQDAMFAGSTLYYLYASRGLTAPATPAVSDASRNLVVQPALRTVTADELLARLAEEPMAPGIEFVTRMPRTVSGKVDRTSLAAAVSSAGSASHAVVKNEETNLRTAVETGVLEICAEVLGHPLSWTDHFFKAGGNSLSAARVVTRIRERYVPDVSIRVIFENPTLERLSARIEELAAERGSTSSGRTAL